MIGNSYCYLLTEKHTKFHHFRSEKYQNFKSLSGLAIIPDFILGLVIQINFHLLVIDFPCAVRRRHLALLCAISSLFFLFLPLLPTFLSRGRSPARQICHTALLFFIMHSKFVSLPLPRTLKSSLSPRPQSDSSSHCVNRPSSSVRP